MNLGESKCKSEDVVPISVFVCYRWMPSTGTNSNWDKYVLNFVNESTALLLRLEHLVLLLEV